MSDKSPETERLDPCPLCGGPAEFYECYHDEYCEDGVQCSECSLRHDTTSNKAEAANLWNTRTESEATKALRAEVENLEAQLDNVEWSNCDCD